MEDDDQQKKRWKETHDIFYSWKSVTQMTVLSDSMLDKCNST